LLFGRISCHLLSRFYTQRADVTYFRHGMQEY